MPSYIFSIFTFLILFASILMYGTADLWAEGFICAAIFLFCGCAEILHARDDSKNENFGLDLLLPLFALGLYSLLQGSLTTFFQNYGAVAPSWLPYSLDPLAGIWVGIKILAVVCFTRFLVKHFANAAGQLVWIVIAVGVFFALFGVLRFITQLSGINSSFLLLPGLKAGVGFGTFINQNHFAFLMLMTLGLMLGLVFKSDFSSEKRFGLLLLSVFILAAIILTGSRGGILSAFGEILFLFILPEKVPLSRDFTPKVLFYIPLKILKSIFAFCSVLVIFLLSIIWIGQDRVIHRFEKLPLQAEMNMPGNSFKRIDLWSATLEMIRDNWFYGTGFGGFKVEVSKHLNISGSIVPQQAHNDYLELIACGGVIALVLLIWFIYKFIVRTRRGFNEMSSVFASAARCGALAGIAGVALHSFFDFGLQIFGNLLFFFALVAIATDNGNSLNRVIIHRTKKLVKGYRDK